MNTDEEISEAAAVDNESSILQDHSFSYLCSSVSSVDNSSDQPDEEYPQMTQINTDEEISAAAADNESSILQDHSFSYLCSSVSSVDNSSAAGV
ncbi:hypothetical protein [Candidatus Thiodictyon syntrophicum]|uniref:hypothetical protein n=1 Tax=Candidatus Thiodictyon syntrophicum TaxID=1166950 RepID=UPI0012FDFD86|nr:hypothetical protein [Candidatus Thiodictyon syntrophicum]